MEAPVSDYHGQKCWLKFKDFFLLFVASCWVCLLHDGCFDISRYGKGDIVLVTYAVCMDGLTPMYKCI